MAEKKQAGSTNSPPPLSCVVSGVSSLRQGEALLKRTTWHWEKCWEIANPNVCAKTRKQPEKQQFAENRKDTNIKMQAK